MKILRYINIRPHIGYFKKGPGEIVRYCFVDLDDKSRGIRKIATEDLVVTDLELYKALYKLSGAVSEIEILQVYFQYVDMKYPAYSYT